MAGDGHHGHWYGDGDGDGDGSGDADGVGDVGLDGDDLVMAVMEIYLAVYKAASDGNIFHDVIDPTDVLQSSSPSRSRTQQLFLVIITASRIIPMPPHHWATSSRYCTWHHQYRHITNILRACISSLCMESRSLLYIYEMCEKGLCTIA